jgi:hypothetical protein
MNPADKFRKKVLSVQDKLAAELLLILSALRIDNGVVLNVAENYSLAQLVEERMYAILKKVGYVDALTELIQALDNRKGLIDAVFSSILPTFSPENNNGVLAFNATKREAIKVLANGAVEMQANEFGKIMSESISASSNYTDLVKNIRANITGSEEFGGRLESYAGTYARDSFSIAERSYSTAIANEFGLEWFVYSGGTIEDSRSFCVERDGKIFHKSEVEAWADEDWQGKNRSTDSSNIFNLCGGYNCIHTLVPIGADQVPEDKRKEFE